MRFGIRIGPFWVSTSSRRKRVRRPTRAQLDRAERERREAEAAAEAQRISRMSAEDYRREAEADPVYRDWLRRQESGIDAQLQQWKDEEGRGKQ